MRNHFSFNKMCLCSSRHSVWSLSLCEKLCCVFELGLNIISVDHFWVFFCVYEIYFEDIRVKSLSLFSNNKLLYGISLWHVTQQQILWNIFIWCSCCCCCWIYISYLFSLLNINRHNNTVKIINKMRFYRNSLLMLIYNKRFFFSIFFSFYLRFWLL